MSMPLADFAETRRRRCGESFRRLGWLHARRGRPKMAPTMAESRRPPPPEALSGNLEVLARSGFPTR